MKALLFGRLDRSGSDLLLSENSSLDFLADLGKTLFLFDRLSSDSSLESTVMEEDLMWDPVFDFLDKAPDFCWCKIEF